MTKIKSNQYKQPSLFQYLPPSEQARLKHRRCHGGVNFKDSMQKTKTAQRSRITGSRKLRRPLIANKWHHVVLKSSKARGPMSFLSPQHRIDLQNLIKEKARKFHIAIGDSVNMGNHFHLKVKFSQREHFQKFLKSITALIARRVTGAKKGKSFGLFWDSLAFTRVLKSSFEVMQLQGYFTANRLEKFEGKLARDIYLWDLNKWLKSLRKNEPDLTAIKAPS